MSKCDSSKNFLYVVNNYDKIIYVNGQSAGRCLQYFVIKYDIQDMFYKANIPSTTIS